MTVLSDLKEYVASEWSQLFDSCNWIQLGRRSRRKAAADGKENSVKGSGKTSSLSQSSTRPRKSPSADFSVCESIDDELLRRLSTPPAGMEPNEWLATHTMAFFNHVNGLCGAVAEFCTPDSCPVMSCPGFQQLPWVDEKGKKWKYSAPQYVDCVMSFCQKTGCSEDLFPTKYGSHFSSAFESHVKRVMKLLWQCCGHLYLAHWDDVQLLALRSQAALVLAHLDLFCTNANLLDAKDSTALRQTVALVRPPIVLDEQCGGGGADGGGHEPMETDVTVEERSGNSGSGCLDGAKSGSWGGVASSSSVVSAACAQTC